MANAEILDALLAAIFGEPRLFRIGESLAGAARTLLELLRRRISQFSQLRDPFKLCL